MSPQPIRKAMRLCLSFLIIFGLSIGMYEGHASATTGNDLQQKINSLTKEQQAKKNQVDATKQKIQQNKSKQQTVQSKISDIVQQIAVTSSKITTKQHTIKNTQSEIAKLNDQIKEVKVRIARRDNLLKTRVKAMYETGSSSNYLQILLASQNFSDFVGRVVILNTIATQDRHILDQQKQDKDQLNAQQTEVKQKLVSLQTDMKELKSLQDSLASKRKDQESMLSTLQSQQKDLEKEQFSQQEIADNLSKEKSAAQKAYQMWKDEEARKAREAAAAAAAAKSSNSSSNSSSGSTPSTSRSTSTNSNAIMAWPVAGGYVTSPYGPRAFDHEFHPGIDIGKGEGAPIMAAADGVVYRAYRSTSYGNCVMMVHYINGVQYSTVYAHMERYVVSDGQEVKQGQVIGYMGHTGEAFGAHLHFEVYKGLWNPPPHPGTINPLSVLP